MWDASLLWVRSKDGQPKDTNFLTAYVDETCIMANYSEFELYLQDKYFETIANKIGSFLPFWPL